MKKKRGFSSTWIVLLITAGLAAYAYFFEYKKGQELDAKKRSDAVVVKLDRTQVNYLELRRKQDSVVLTKADGIWKLSEPVKDLADQDRVQTLIQSLTTETSSEVVAEKGEVDLKTFGLDAPITSAVLKTDNQSVEVKIGSVKSFDSQLYAQVDGESKVLLVGQAWDIHLSTPTKDLRDRRLIRTQGLNPDTLTISSPKSAKVRLEKKDEKWVLVEGGDKQMPLDSGAISAYIKYATGIKGDDFLSENAKADSVRFGFNQPLVKVEFASAGKPIVALMGSEKNAIMSTERDAIFSAQPKVMEGLKRTAASFFDKKIPFQIDKSLVRSIEITADNAQMSLKKENGAWTLAKPAQGKELDSAKVDELLDHVSSLEVDRYLGQTPALGLRPGKNEIVISGESGQKLLQFNWGGVYTEKGVAKESDDPRDKLFFVKTSKADQTLLLTEDKILGLELDGLLRESKK